MLVSRKDEKVMKIQKLSLRSKNEKETYRPHNSRYYMISKSWLRLLSSETDSLLHLELMSWPLNESCDPLYTSTLIKYASRPVLFLFIRRYCTLLKQAWLTILDSLWKISLTYTFASGASLVSAFLLLCFPFLLSHYSAVFFLFPSLFFIHLTKFYVVPIKCRYHFRHGGYS